MAHISEFKVGDEVVFPHKGASVKVVITKINRKSVKATQLEDATWKVQAAFGRRGYIKHAHEGQRWTLGVGDSGTVSFRHLDETKAQRSLGNSVKVLENAVRECVKAGMSQTELLKLVRAAHNRAVKAGLGG